MEFGPFRAKTIERWSARLAKNLKIESKLGFQVKITVFEGLRLGDLRWPNMTPSSVEFDFDEREKTYSTYDSRVVPHHSTR